MIESNCTADCTVGWNSSKDQIFQTFRHKLLLHLHNPSPSFSILSLFLHFLLLLFLLLLSFIFFLLRWLPFVRIMLSHHFFLIFLTFHSSFLFLLNFSPPWFIVRSICFLFAIIFLLMLVFRDCRDMVTINFGISILFPLSCPLYLFLYLLLLLIFEYNGLWRRLNFYNICLYCRKLLWWRLMLVLMSLLFVMRMVDDRGGIVWSKLVIWLLLRVGIIDDAEGGGFSLFFGFFRGHFMGLEIKYYIAHFSDFWIYISGQYYFRMT